MPVTKGTQTLETSRYRLLLRQSLHCLDNIVIMQQVTGRKAKNQQKYVAAKISISKPKLFCALARLTSFSDTEKLYLQVQFYNVALYQTQLITSWTIAFAGVTPDFQHVIPAKAGIQYPRDGQREKRDFQLSLIRATLFFYLLFQE